MAAQSSLKPTPVQMKALSWHDWSRRFASSFWYESKTRKKSMKPAQSTPFQSKYNKMMKIAVLAALAGSAAAFAPAPAARASTSISADFSGEIGAQQPLGLFDPLGIVADADQAEFDRLRGVELKHGRVAMLGVVGYLVTYAGVRFPGAEDIPSGFAAWGALAQSDAGVQVLAQMALSFAIFEAANRDQWEWGVNPNLEGESPAEFVGDFRNGALDFGWDKMSDEMKLKKRAIELNNGRAAQMGLLGLMVHEKLGNIDSILP